MYKVIAILKKYEGTPFERQWISGRFKSLTLAQEHVAKRKVNPHYNFRIVKEV